MNFMIYILIFISSLFSETTNLSPGADLRTAISKAQSGDTLLLAPGNYNSFGYINNIKFDPSNPLVIRSSQHLAAIIKSGNAIHFYGCQGISLEGFEITDLVGNAGLVQISSGSNHIWIKDCWIHHAQEEADCLKANQAKNVYIENCRFHDPGARANGDGNQEALDLLDIEGGRIAGCLFTGNNSRQFINAKGGSKNILIENNILIGHDGSNSDAAIILGGWSARSLINGDYEGVNQTARNNIIIGSKTGAIQINNVNGAYVYNNLMYECEGYGDYRGLVFIAPGNGVGMNKGNRKVRFVNNIFYNNAVPMPIEIATRVGEIEDLQTSSNLYYNGGKAIPGQGAFNPNNEKQAVFVRPNMPLLSKLPLNSTPPNLLYKEIVKLFKPSTSGVLTDKGSNMIQSYPEGRGKGISGIARDTLPDIGPFEWLPTNSIKMPIYKRIIFYPNKRNRDLLGRFKILESF